MTHFEDKFEQGLELLRQHEYAKAANFFSELKAQGSDITDIDLYIRIASRENDRLRRFVGSRKSYRDSLLGDLARKRDACRASKQRERFDKAIHAVETDNYSCAIGILEELLVEDSACTCVNLVLAHCCLASGHLSEALQYAGVVKSKNVPSSKAYAMLGAIQMEVGREREAEQSFRESLNISDREGDAWFGLAILYFENKRYDLAESCVRKALRIHPSWIGAASLLDEIVKGWDETEQLIADCKAAIDKHPEYADQHHQLGLCYTYQGRYEEALCCFEKALEINPNLSKTFLQLANLYLSRDRFQDACRCFRKAKEKAIHVVAEPSSLARAALYEEALDFQSACQEYSEALRLVPDYAAKYIENAKKFMDIGLVDQAEKEAKRGLQLAPNYADAYYLLAKIHMKASLPDLAMESLYHALKINPLYEDAAYDAINLLKTGGRREDIEVILSAWRDRERKIPDRIVAITNRKGGRQC